MKKITLLLLCTFLFLSITGCKSSGDSTEGKQQEAGGESARIVSTSAVLCQVADRLNLDLVGVPDTDFELPKRYEKATRVGAPMTPDLEVLKSLNPTDVLTPNSLQYDLKPKYDGAGIPSTFINLMSLDGFFQEIEMLGDKYDRKKEADTLVSEYTLFMKEYQEKTKGKEKPKVLILMGLPGSYMIATERSYVGSLVHLAGGENVFEGDDAFLNVNTEELALRKPDIILRTSHAMPEVVQEMFEKDFQENDIWKHFSAVKEGKVYDLKNEVFGMSANLEYQQALNTLQELLYGNGEQ